MSKEKIFLTNPVEISFAEEGGKEGTFNGIAYSGKPIKRHGWYQNLIIDTSNIRFKRKVPIYRDHNHKEIVGYAKLSKNEDYSVSIVGGKFLESSLHAAEVRDYAAEGFEWEMSVGLSPDYEMETVKDGESVEVNGIKIKSPATIIRNSRISEVSFVAVGADEKTNTQVFKQLEKGVIEMELEKKIEELEGKLKETEGLVFTQEQIDEIALACSCEKGSKPSEVKAGAEGLKSENEKLKKEVEELKKELEAFKKEKKKKQMSEAAEGRVELSNEKMEELLEDEEKFNAYLEVLSSVEKKKLIKKEFAETKDVSGEAPKLESQAEIKLAAQKLMEEGKASSFAEAISLLNIEG